MSIAEPPSITQLPLAEPPPPGRPRVKKLRLALILSGLGVLAVVSTIFGMMMAVASDLPALENDARFKGARNSVMVDVHGRTLGTLVSNQNQRLVSYDEISPAMRRAIIAIEDRRFYTNSGVDLRGIGRAFFQDVVQQKAVQGGSTITQQFVKVALEAQQDRTIFQKLRESALAYHLTRKWTKEHILREYLNGIYFGNGAYGIESAARTYFGSDHPNCGEPKHPACASLLQPDEAALIAGVVANPSGFDPVAHPEASKRRRNVVLKAMLDQGAITPADYRAGIKESIPVVTPPFDDSKAPYFTTWVRQQMVDRYGAERAFKGGLRVRTTLDLNLQDAAQQAVNNYLADPNGPTASIVAIDNETGAVRAMVGGRATNGQEFARTPFNLATQGQRQPGSAFKPFVLAAALRKGISPSSTWTSKRKQFDVPGTGGKEKFVVNNYEGNYAGVTSLAGATVTSDNSVYAEVGFRTGFRRIARMARDMGIRSPVSTNPAITLGGLKQGVSVLDMAHAYETLAQRGLRVEGSLGASGGGPVGIRDVSRPSGTDADGNPKYSVINRNETHKERIFSRQLADVEVPILGSVVTSGTGKRAAIPGTFVAGKTGTTENYGDAWFVGFTDKLTVAVWVGYPNEVRPMKTEFRGQPVAGGTFPAMIWRDFMASAIKYFADRDAAKRAREGLPPTGTTTVPPATEPPVTTTATAPTGATSTPAAAPQTTPRTTPAPAPTPTTPAAPAPGTPAPTAPPPAQGQPTTGAGTGGAGAGSP